MSALDDLSEPARLAHRAFRDMSQSKTAHFDCLVDLENKYKLGGAPSDAEKRLLAGLLEQHDKNVQAFKAALSAVTDRDEKQILFKLFS